MIAKVLTGALFGIETSAVEVQVRVRSGKPMFSIIGLADTAVREARDRVAAALSQVGVALSDQVLVNLSPAELKKEGSGFDLAIAVGILSALRAIPPAATAERIFHGELALDGSLRPVRGCLSCALLARQMKLREMVVPAQSEREARLVPGLSVTGSTHLRHIIRWLRDDTPPPPVRQDDGNAPNSIYAGVHASESSSPNSRSMSRLTLAQVRGQHAAKRALLVAAAGGHHLLMVGPPGCGKSMLAARFPGLLPPLEEHERIETARVYSAAGLPLDEVLSESRVWRSPHHSISEAGLIGGGAIPRPGEVSLAHRGVLFLDELPEFRRAALEALRSPLETGMVTLSRARGQVTLPARFQLIAAMNPCPCGRLGASSSSAEQGSTGRTCMCSRTAIESYLKKTSQPILDRIDLQVELQAVPTTELFGAELKQGEADSPECSRGDEAPSMQVQHAQARQYERQGKLNAALEGEEIQRQKRFDAGALALLERGARQLHLSARGTVRCMRVSATIADLSAATQVDSAHVAEALQYRALSILSRYGAGVAAAA